MRVALSTVRGDASGFAVTKTIQTARTFGCWDLQDAMRCVRGRDERPRIQMVAPNVVPTHPALVSISQRRIVEISGHQRWWVYAPGRLRRRLEHVFGVATRCPKSGIPV